MGPSISKLECASVAGPAVPRSHRSGFAGGGLDAAMLAKSASLRLAFKIFQTLQSTYGGAFEEPRSESKVMRGVVRC